MNQSRLLVSLEKQLDQTEATINTFVLIAVVSLLAGVSGVDPIKAAGFEIPRKEAFIVLGLIFCFANFLMLIFFLRVNDLILNIDDDNIVEGLSVLGLHKWIFNPFSFFQSSYLSIAYNTAGFGCCIVTWWVGFSALQSVRPDNADDLILYNSLTATYLTIGLISMFAVNKCFKNIATRAISSKMINSRVLRDLTVFRTMLSLVDIGVGGAIASITGSLQIFFNK